MIIASKSPAKIGDIVTFYQREFGESPSARGKILREASLDEFMAEDHPQSTKLDLERYLLHPCPYHYEVSTD